jgi:VRR-NUC domain
VKEAEFQSAIMEMARLSGWTVFHHHDSRREVNRNGARVLVGDRDAKGYPDLTLVHARRRLVIWREIKTERGRLSIAQREWLDVLIAAGFDAKVWRPKDRVEIESTLTGRRR